MKSLDERAAELAKSQSFGDIRIPLDVASRLRKSEKKDTVDEVDIEKIHAQKESDKEEGGDEDAKKEKSGDKPGEKPEAPGQDDAEKSFRAVEGSTLQKAHLMKMSRTPDAGYVRIGAWVSGALQKSEVEVVKKAILSALPEFQKSGKTLVAGLKEPGAIPAGSGDAQILRLNTEVSKLQAALSDAGADPFDLSVIFVKLQEAYERLAEAIMNSLGHGQQTEDIIAPDPKAEPAAALESIHKSQAVSVPENSGGEIVVSL